jgi:hypothetical protein
MEPLDDALSQRLLDAATLKIIQERIEYLTNNPPNMICVNVVLNGNSALKHAICKEIIMHASNITEQDADWYILRAGAERELERLSTISIKNDP